MDESEGAASATITIKHLVDSFAPADRNTLSVMFPVVYEQLHRQAQRYLKGERAGHTLQATALVHEVFLNLVEGATLQISDRAHFFRIAARTMRHLLINHAEGRRAQKRGGGRKALSIEDSLDIGDGGPDENLLCLEEALVKLGEAYPQKAQVVELRYFGGCTIDETAEALGIGTATVERDWRFAKAWLLGALTRED